MSSIHYLKNKVEVQSPINGGCFDLNLTKL